MEILNGMKEIKARFGVSRAKVREWVDNGAPIIVHNAARHGRTWTKSGKGNGMRYSCDPDRLYDWLLANQQIAKIRQDFGGRL